MEKLLKDHKWRKFIKNYNQSQKLLRPITFSWKSPKYVRLPQRCPDCPSPVVQCCGKYGNAMPDSGAQEWGQGAWGASFTIFLTNCRLCESLNSTIWFHKYSLFYKIIKDTQSYLFKVIHKPSTSHYTKL